MCTKQTTYTKYNNYIPSNPFKTVKNACAFITQKNFLNSYCLQHFICNSGVGRRLSETVHIASQLQVHNVLSKSHPQILVSLLTVTSALQCSPPGPLLQHNHELFFLLSIKTQEAFCHFGWLIEAQTLEKLVRDTHRALHLFFYYPAYLLSMEYTPFLCLLQSSLTSSLKPWYHPCSISHRDLTTNNCLSKKFSKTCHLNIMPIVKDSETGKKNHGTSYPVNFIFYGIYYLLSSLSYLQLCKL